MIGDRLKEFLDSKELSPAEFSRITKKSQGYIGDLLHNRKQNIGSDFLIALSSNFPELNIKWFLTGEGNMFSGEEKKELTPEEKVPLMRQLMKEYFDLTDKDLQIFEKHLLDNKEFGIMAFKALNGDVNAKSMVKKIIDGN